MSLTAQQKKNSKPVQYKSLYLKEATLSEDGRKVSGYLAVFGVKDSDDDVLIKGCFAKSLTDRGPASTTNRKIAFLWQHDMKQPIGRFTELKEDGYGLYFEAEIDDFELGNRVITQLKSGTLNQFSIGYNYVWDKMEYDENLGAFIVKEVMLFEGSVVTMGANEWTYFGGMKAELLEDHRKNLFTETEAFIKSLPVDDQYQTRQLIAKHIALATAQPGKPLLKEEPQGPPAFDLTEAIKQTKFFN